MSKLFNRIDSLIEDKKQRSLLKNEILSKLFKAELIDPYFPLTRQGDYWLTYNIEVYDKIENKTTTEIAVEAFEGPSERARAMKILANTPGVTDIVDYVNAEAIDYNKAPPSSWVAQTLRVLNDNIPDTKSTTLSANGTPVNAKQETINEVMRMFVAALPESSFAKSLQKREDRLGYNEDAELAFQTKAYNLARQTEQLKYAEILRQTVKEIDTSAEEKVKESDSFLSRRAAAENSKDKKKLAQVNKEIATYEKEKGPLLSSANKRLAMIELQKRVDFAINPPSNLLERSAQFANRVAFLGTIGFNVSSTVVNFGQVPMVVLPFLSAKVGFNRARTNIKTALNLYGASGFDHVIPTYSELDAEGKPVKTEYIRTGYKNPFGKTKISAPSIDNYYVADIDGVLRLRDDIDIDDKELYYAMKMDKDGKTREFTKKQFLEFILPFVQRVQDHGQLNRSLIFDTLGSEISGKKTPNKVGRAFDTFTVLGALPFHTAERANRQITLVSTFLTEIERINTNPNKNKKEELLSFSEIVEGAQLTALYETQQTNGGATLSTSSGIAQKNIGRVAMMFKTFGAQMYYIQAKTALQMIKRYEKDPYLRKQYMYQFFGMTGMTALMAGVQGMTLYGIIAGVANRLFLDDDEETFESLTRQAIGEGFFKGGVNKVLSLAGMEVDVASRIGLSNMLLGSNRYNYNSSFEGQIVDRLGGPAYSYGKSISRGVKKIIFQGDYQRGIEAILPAAFRNMAKVGRYIQEDGARTVRGDMVLGLDDMGYTGLAGQLLGFAPADFTLRQEANQDLKRIDVALNKKRTTLLKKYYQAYRFGDYYGMQDIQRDIDKFNKRFPRGTKPHISTTTIKQSMARHKKISEEMVDGVLFSPTFKAALLMERDDYGDL